jgi:hypothetical protein
MKDSHSEYKMAGRAAGTAAIRACPVQATTINAVAQGTQEPIGFFCLRDLVCFIRDDTVGLLKED